MSAGIQFTVETDPEIYGLKATLARIEQKLDAQGVNQHMAFADIKSALDSAVDALDNVDKDVTKLDATIEDLKAQIVRLQGSISDEQAAELQATADKLKAQTKAIADRTPEDVVPEPPVV